MFTSHAPPQINRRYILESISMVALKREMPLLDNLLSTDPNWIVFDKPLKINDNTVPNLFGLLTGRQLLDPKEVELDRHFVNVSITYKLPIDFDTDVDWIWKRFK